MHRAIHAKAESRRSAVHSNPKRTHDDALDAISTRRDAAALLSLHSQEISLGVDV